MPDIIEELDLSGETPQETTDTSGNTERPEVIDGGSGTSEIPEEIPAETTEKSGVQKRMDALTAEKYRERRRADGLAAELEKLKAEAPVVETGLPTLEQFDYDVDKYNDALITYRVNQGLKTAETQRRERESAVTKSAAVQQFEKRVAEAGIGGYHEAVTALATSVPLSEALIDTIQQDENGPQLAYYLGTNLDVADRIAGKTPIAAALELGKISAGLTGKPIKKISNAATPLQRTEGASGVAKDVENMSMEEIFNLP